MTRGFLVILLMAVLGVFSGCEKQQKENSQNAGGAFSPPNIAASVSPAPRVREVVDMAGRTVKLRQEINRIGTLGSVPMMNTFVESLGAGRKIYNQPSKFHDIHGRWKMHLEFAPQLAQGPHFQSASHDLLIENILQADPDVCITNSRSILDVLNKLDVPTVFVDWSTVQRMMDSVIMMGEVLHEQKRAATYVQYFQETKDRLREISKVIAPSEKLAVLYSNPMQFRAPGSLTEEWLEAIGAASVSRGAYLQGRHEYDLEELLKWDPEVIFLTSRTTAEELKSNPVYKNIRAVKNDFIVLAPTVGHMWGGHTVEAPIAACWMMHKLYPELMSKEKLTEEIKYFYKTFFAYDMNDEKVNEIIAGGWS